MRCTLLLVVLAAGLAAANIVPTGWLSWWAYDTYAGQAGILPPSKWYLYAPTCGNLVQSPIDIVPRDAQVLLASRNPTASLYLECTTSSFVVENRGSMVSFVSTTPQKCTLTDISGNAYYLGAIEFHWNNNAFAQTGSEHTIDTFSYPVEAQLMFYRSAFATYSDPLETAKGVSGTGNIAALSVFLTAGPGAKTADLSTFYTMSKLAPGAVNSTLYPLNPMSLIPTAGLSVNQKGYYAYDFYRYTGSLTYPPCIPNGIYWNVFQQPINVPIAQINMFRRVTLDLTHEVVSNNRPTTTYYPTVNYYMKSPKW